MKSQEGQAEQASGIIRKSVKLDERVETAFEDVVTVGFDKPEDNGYDAQHGKSDRSGASKKRRSKTMGLYMRGQVWWMTFVYQGRQMRKSTETTSKTLAKKIFDKVKGQIAEGKWFESLPGKDTTFAEMMDKYFEEFSMLEKMPSSIKRDRSIIKNLKAVFGKKYVVDIQTKDVNAYKTKRRKVDKVSKRTVNYELIVMGHAYNLAINEWQWVRVNPVKNVKKFKVKNKIERWLSPEEEASLMKVCAGWLKDIIVFAIHTGFRQSEILDLQWGQIDFQRKTITISEQKNGGVDTLPLSKTALALLTRRRAASDGSACVFPDENGLRMPNQLIQRVFRGAVKAAGVVKFRFHDLRHTFATRLVQSGVDLYTVAHLGRWKTIEMVKRYAHHYPESLRPGIEKLDVATGPKITNLSQFPGKRAKQGGHKPQLRLVTPRISYGAGGRNRTDTSPGEGGF
jgi:integrase